MPLVQRPIHVELSLVSDKLYKEAKDVQILQDIGEASLLGTFEQLGLLSNYAAEIFKGILKETETSFSQVKRMNARGAPLPICERIEGLTPFSLFDMFRPSAPKPSYPNPFKLALGVLDAIDACESYVEREKMSYDFVPGRIIFNSRHHSTDRYHNTLLSLCLGAKWRRKEKGETLQMFDPGTFGPGS